MKTENIIKDLEKNFKPEDKKGNKNLHPSHLNKDALNDFMKSIIRENTK